jgi:hypothetical protein
VSITADQTIRMNVVCFEHPVLGSAPDPCAGELMFHDMDGNTLARQVIRLAPGQAAYLEFGFRVGGLSGINPCWIPDPTSGRALPSVEVIDAASGKVALCSLSADSHTRGRRWKSSKRRTPRNASRTRRIVQRSPRTSRARAIGQFWVS